MVRIIQLLQHFPEITRWKASVGRRLTRVTEYITFGRRPGMIFYILMLQVINIFSEIGVSQRLHPYMMDVLDAASLVELYSAVTVGALFVLSVIVFKMGELTFAPRFQHLEHISLSVLSYLITANLFVIPFFMLQDVPPNWADGISMPDLLLAAMTSTVLAALFASGFYAQFNSSGFPTRTELKDTIDDWVATINSVENPTDARQRDAWHREFQSRSTNVSELLDYAMTSDGRALKDEFEGWYSNFEEYDYATREAIVQGDIETAELRELHERFRRIVNELQYIADEKAKYAEASVDEPIGDGE